MENLKLLLSILFLVPASFSLNSYQDGFPGGVSRDDQFHLPHIQEITNGVETINGGNSWPSYIALFGENMFPIASDGKWVIFSGGIYGKGRVIIAGQEAFVNSGGSDPGLIKLTQNSVKWLAQADSLENIKLSTWTSNSVGNLPATSGVSVSNLDPKTTQVYYIPMRYSFKEEDIKKLKEFVENGGGLMIAGHIWAWYNNNGGINNSLKNPGNRMIKSFGAIMGTNVLSANTLVKNLEMNMHYALKTIYNVDDQGKIPDEAMRSIDLYTNIVFTLDTYKDPDFNELFQVAMNVFNNIPDNIDKNLFSRLVSKLLPLLLLKNPTSVKKASDSDQFPGKVSDNSERVTKVLTVNGTYIGYPSGFQYSGASSPLWVSTGLYAGPGEVVKIKISREDLGKLPADHKLKVRIGCHTDTLYGRENAKRSPEISTVSYVVGEESSAANPWGGLIYILVPYGVQYPMFEVTITNAVKAPYFVLGENNLEEWKSTLRNAPAPWGELEVKDQFVFSFQSTELREYEDPVTFLSFYKDIMHQYNYMQGFEGNYRFRAERYVGDIEISYGWLHAGYPIMGFMSQVKGILDINLAKTGQNWGLYHEIGHNAQWSGYTTGSTQESGCNVYAHHIHKNFFNIESRYPQELTDAEIIKWVLEGRTSYTGYIAAVSYTLLLDKYGFDHWGNMNKFYYQNPNEVSKDKFDTFAWVMSNELKMNLCPYYEFFAYQLSERTLEACKKHPDMPDLIIDRYYDVLNPPEVEHGECPPGWMPYGKSCFYISEGESLTWNDAESACTKNQNPSHLASCLSQQESYFLARHLKENQIKGFYHIGINENNEENVPKFLDGSMVPELFPWTPGRPKKDGSKCVGIENGYLFDKNCSTKGGYICKSGPTSCGPKK